MTRYLKELISYSALLVFILFAGFTEAGARESDNPFYFGISGGQTRVKNTATQEYQDATSFGIQVGVRIYANDFLWSGTELKYTKTTAREEVNEAGSSTISTYEVETTGLYLTGRTRGKAYLKGKVGAANQVIQVNDIAIQDTTRGSYGVGAGVRQGNAILELEYTQYGDDVTVVSVGYVFGY